MTREWTWPLVLAAATIAGTLATACMMPFVGLAVVAAATMGRGAALVTVIGAWAANQVIGFGLMGYPFTPYAFAWGGALGAASAASMLVARSVLGGSRSPGRIGAAFAAAFAADEALLYGFALAVGGTETFTPAIAATLALNDAAWAAVLLLLHAMLGRAAPRVFARSQRA